MSEPWRGFVEEAKRLARALVDGPEPWDAEPALRRAYAAGMRRSLRVEPPRTTGRRALAIEALATAIERGEAE